MTEHQDSKARASFKLKTLRVSRSVACLAVATFSFCLDTPSFATTLATRGGVHETFDRIVFDWPSKVTYSLQQSEGAVTITFDAEAEISFKPLLSAKLKRASDFSVVQNAEGKLVVRFSTPPKTAIKDFSSGSAIVLDLSPHEAAKTLDKKIIPQQSVAPTPEPIKREPIPTPPTPPEEQKGAHLPAVNVPQAISPALPVILEAQLASKSPQEKATAPINHQASPPQNAPSTALSVTTPAAETHSAPTKNLGYAEVKTVLNKNVKPLELGSTPEIVLSLDPRIEIGAVVFGRGGYGYVFFDRKLTIDFATLTALQPSPRVAVEPIDLPNNTGFRFSFPAGYDLRANRAGTAWQFFLSNTPREVTVSNSLVSQPDFALGSRLLLPTIDPPEPIFFTDPVIGDTLVAIPLRQIDAFSIARRYADLEIIAGAQGLVLKPLVEKLLVRKVADGIEVTAQNGLRLSPANETGFFDKSMARNINGQAGKNIFDFALWSGKPGESFTQTKQRLSQTAVDVPKTERNRARFELARFYLAHGLGEESLALLKFLTQEDPELKNYSEYQVMNGAAEILCGRAEQGLAALQKTELKFQPEIELWQAVAQVQLRDWKGAEEKFALTHAILNDYPEPFFSKFSVLAIESAIAMGKDYEAADWLAQIDMRPHRAEITPALNYLHAVLHSKAGRQPIAEELWKLVAKSEDRLYAVRAKLALIDLGVATRSLTPAQAAEQMENLRFVWRGDELEAEILRRLGLFYLDAKNMKAGLSILSQALRLYPDSPLAEIIKGEMTKAFSKAFTSDAIASMSPIEALSLYQSHSDLVPAGAARTEVIRSLAERLVSIDLLDQASSLLEGLIKDALQGEEKAKVGTRLAAIRLLDHKPDLALQALTYGPNDGIPPDLLNERALLKARAFSQQKKEDEALALLLNNNSAPAKLLKADINMRAHRWPAAAKALADLLPDQPAQGDSLSFEQGQIVLNTAIAMALSGDTQGLEKLADTYSASMTGNAQFDTFRILTRPEKLSQFSNIAAAQSRLTEVDMFKGFLENYRKPPTVLKQ